MTDEEDLEERLRGIDPRSIPVGWWHSHVWTEEGLGVLDAIVPQLTTADRDATEDGTVAMICSVNPTQEGMPRRGNGFRLHAEIGGKTCRLEAWLRKGKRFVPCEIKVR